MLRVVAWWAACHAFSIARLLQAPQKGQSRWRSILILPRLFYCLLQGADTKSMGIMGREIKAGKPSNKWWWVFAVLWFALWHIWHTWPVWHDPSGRVPGPIGDNTVMLWNLGWVKHALDRGSPGFWFPNAYYPDGFLFLYGTHTWLDGVIGWLLSPVMPAGYFGSILWANVNHLVSTVCTGLLVVWGGRAFGVRRWPVLLLVASAVTFCWFRMFALSGHYHFYGTHWMLAGLALLSWYRNLREAEAGKAVRWLLIGGGVFTGLAFLNDQTHAVFAGVLGSILIVSGGKGRGQKAARDWLVFAGCAGLVAAVHLVPMGYYFVTGGFEYQEGAGGSRLVDASSLVLPPQGHAFSWPVGGLRDIFGFWWAEGTYLGLVPIGLLLVSVLVAARGGLGIESGRERRLVVTVTTLAIGFIVIALGDRLTLGKWDGFPLPGALLREVPVLNGIRLPQRWIWPAQLCLGLAGAVVLDAWVARGRQRWRACVLYMLAIIPPLEAQRYPLAAVVDYRKDEFLHPVGLIKAVSNNYTDGAVFAMPVSPDYLHGVAYGNILQFQWGYHIPATMVYTARMPYGPGDVPWKWNNWNDEAGEWLRKKRVSMVIFPMQDVVEPEFTDWIAGAKQAVPGLLVFDKNGKSL